MLPACVAASEWRKARRTCAWDGAVSTLSSSSAYLREETASPRHARACPTRPLFPPLELLAPAELHRAKGAPRALAGERAARRRLRLRLGPLGRRPLRHHRLRRLPRDRGRRLFERQPEREGLARRTPRRAQRREWAGGGDARDRGSGGRGGGGGGVGGWLGGGRVGRLLTARSSIARDRSAALAARLRSQPAGTWCGESGVDEGRGGGREARGERRRGETRGGREGSVREGRSGQGRAAAESRTMATCSAATAPRRLPVRVGESRSGSATHVD